MKRQRGFTLLELLITLSIVAVLAAIGIPAFNNVLADSRLTSATNGLVGSLNLARSEAIESGAQVVVETNADGWQLKNLSTNIVLRTFSAPGGDISIVRSSPTITFQANGYRTFNSPVVTFDVESSSLNRCRRITISVAGSVSMGACP